MSTEEYELIKKDYNEGKIFISVVLTKARQALTNIEYKPLIYYHMFMYASILASCVYSFFALNWLGILYLIIFPFMCFSYMGYSGAVGGAGNNKKIRNDIAGSGLILSIVSLLFNNIGITILVAISFAILYFVCYLYIFASKALIDKFLLVSKDCFEVMLNDVFFVKDANGKILYCDNKIVKN